MNTALVVAPSRLPVSRYQRKRNTPAINAMPAARPFMLSNRFTALVIATTQKTTIERSTHQGNALLK